MTESQGPNKKSKVSLEDSGEKRGIKKNLSNGWKIPIFGMNYVPLKTYRSKIQDSKWIPQRHKYQAEHSQTSEN